MNQWDFYQLMDLCMSWQGHSKVGSFSSLPQLLLSPGISWVLFYLLWCAYRLQRQVSVGGVGTLQSLLCMCTTSNQLTVCKDFYQAFHHCPTTHKSLFNPWLVHLSTLCQTGLQYQWGRNTTLSNLPSKSPLWQFSRCLQSSSKAAGFHSLLYPVEHSCPQDWVK